MGTGKVPRVRARSLGLTWAKANRGGAARQHRPLRLNLYLYLQEPRPDLVHHAVGWGRDCRTDLGRGLITETVVSVLCQKARHRAGPCFNHDSLLFLRCALGSCSLQLVVEDPLHGLAIGRNCHFDNADDLAFAQGIQGNVTVSGTAIVVTGHSVTLTWTVPRFRAVLM